jgi:hypothetical protein
MTKCVGWVVHTAVYDLIWSCVAVHVPSTLLRFLSFEGN